jgi:hypothetical protein
MLTGKIILKSGEVYEVYEVQKLLKAEFTLNGAPLPFNGTFKIEEKPEERKNYFYINGLIVEAWSGINKSGFFHAARLFNYNGKPVKINYINRSYEEFNFKHVIEKLLNLQ